MNCAHCNTKFELLKSTSGYEQKYCTPYCKNKAAEIRKEKRFTYKIIQENAPTLKPENTFTKISDNSNYNPNKINGYQNQSNISNDNSFFSMENVIKREIMINNLENELRNRTIELSMVNAELTEYENEENEETPKVDYLGKLLENPTAIISGIFLVIDGIKERTATKKTA